MKLTASSIGTRGNILVRKKARLFVALTSAIVIAGLFVGFAMSKGTATTSRQSASASPRRVVWGNPGKCLEDQRVEGIG